MAENTKAAQSLGLLGTPPAPTRLNNATIQPVSDLKLPQAPAASVPAFTGTKKAQ